MAAEYNNQRHAKLVWIVNGTIREVVLQNAPYGVCVWKKNILENTTYLHGKLAVVSIDTKT